MNFSMFFLPSIFVVIAFIITKKNAKYLLSGYNTMSELEREKVDLDAYLRLFKRFHIFLAVSLLAITFFLSMVSENVGDVFPIIYIFCAYAFFGFKSIRFFNPSRLILRFSHVISSFLVVGAGAVLYFSLISFKESELKIQGDLLELTGIYGVKIDKKNLTEVRIIGQMPRITSRTNGFNGGVYRKGNFRLSDRRSVKLFINTNSKSFLLLRTLSGDIYFSSNNVDLAELYRRVRAWAGLGST